MYGMCGCVCVTQSVDLTGVEKDKFEIKVFKNISWLNIKKPIKCFE